MTKFLKGGIVGGARAAASSLQRSFFSVNRKLSHHPSVINHRSQTRSRSHGVAAVSSSSSTAPAASAPMMSFLASFSGWSQLSFLSVGSNMRHYSSSHQFGGSLHHRQPLPSNHGTNKYDVLHLHRHSTTAAIAPGGGDRRQYQYPTSYLSVYSFSSSSDITTSQAVPLSPELRDTLLRKLIEPNNNKNNNNNNNSNNNNDNNNNNNNNNNNLGKWTLLHPPSRDAITKTYHFIDFQQAWTFMTKVSILAEEMNHHPEWSNVYNRVEVTLTTHDCNGLSTNDIEMATKMDEYELELLSGRPQTTQCST